MIRRAAVTGAAGRVGREVVSRLLKRDWSVVALDRARSDSLSSTPGVNFVKSDLSDADALSSVLKGCDAVIHLAALMSWKLDDASSLFEADVSATFSLLEALRRSGGGTLIFASSGEVYPESRPTYLPIDENHPTLPMSHYGAFKLIGETLCWFYSRRFGFPTTVVRLPHTQDAAELLDAGSRFSGPRFFLGPKLLQARAFGQLEAIAALEKYDDGSEKLVISRGDTGESYAMPIADTRDTAAGVIAALEAGGARGETIAISPAEPVVFEDAVPKMAAMVGLPVVDVELPGPPIRYSVDNSKAQRLLGFTPCHSFDEMVVVAAQAYADRQRSR